VSSMVNMTCRKIILGDREYHQIMAKEHYMKYKEHQYLNGRIDSFAQTM